MLRYIARTLTASLFVPLCILFGCSRTSNLPQYLQIRDKLAAYCDQLEKQSEHGQICYDGCTLYSFYNGTELVGSYCEFGIAQSNTCATHYTVEKQDVSCRDFLKRMDEIDTQCKHCINYSAIDT